MLFPQHMKKTRNSNEIQYIQSSVRQHLVIFTEKISDRAKGFYFSFTQQYFLLFEKIQFHLYDSKLTQKKTNDFYTLFISLHIHHLFNFYRIFYITLAYTQIYQPFLSTGATTIGVDGRFSSFRRACTL